MLIFTTQTSLLLLGYASFYFVCAVTLSLILINAFLYIRYPLNLNCGIFSSKLFLQFESMLNRLIDAATANSITAPIAISLCIFSTTFSKICIMFSNFFGLNFLTPHPYLSLFTLDLSLFSNAEFFSQLQSRASFWDLLLKKGPRIFRLYSDQRKDKVLFLSLCVNPIVKRLTPLFHSNIPNNQCLEALTPITKHLLESLSQDEKSCQILSRLLSHVACTDSVKACSEKDLNNATIALVKHINLVLLSFDLDKNPKTLKALTEFLIPFLNPVLTLPSQLQDLFPCILPLLSSLSKDEQRRQSIAGLVSHYARQNSAPPSKKPQMEQPPRDLLEDATQALVKVFTDTLLRIDLQLETNRKSKNTLCSLLTNSLFSPKKSSSSRSPHLTHDQTKQEQDVAYVISQIQRLTSASTLLNFSGQYVLTFLRNLPSGLSQIYSPSCSRTQQLKLLMTNPALGSPDQIQSALSSPSFWLKILDDPSLIEKTILWTSKLLLRASTCLSLDDLHPARFLFPDSPLQDLTARQLHDLIDLAIKSIRKIKNGRQIFSEAAAAYFSHNPDRFFANKAKLRCLSVLLINTINDPELKQSLASDEYSRILQKILRFYILQSLQPSIGAQPSSEKLPPIKRRGTSYLPTQKLPRQYDTSTQSSINSVSF